MVKDGDGGADDSVQRRTFGGGDEAMVHELASKINYVNQVNGLVNKSTSCGIMKGKVFEDRRNLYASF